MLPWKNHLHNSDYPNQSFLCCALWLYQIELLKGTTKLNHFALKSKLYLQAIHSAYAMLRELNPVSLAA